MKTLLNKFLFGALFIFLSWKGLDGLILNAIHSDTTTIDVWELEKHPLFESRNVKITNGCAGSALYLQADYAGPIDILYPLLSAAQVINLSKGKPIRVKVLVRLKNRPSQCVGDRSCLPKDSTPVKGLVKVGFENLNTDDFKAFESDLVQVDKDALLVDPEEETIVWYWNLAMFLIGTVLAFVIVKSFFRKASSMGDYFKKIMEEEEE